MTLANPWWLALALPAWSFILALHARRRTTVIVPSLLGWERSNARELRHQRRRLPPWSLPLVVQLLAVAMVALALAEPVLGTSDQRHVVVFVASPDASGATDVVRDVASRVGSRATVTVVDVRGAIRPVVAMATPARALEVVRDRLVDDDALPVWDRASTVLETLRIDDVVVVAVVADDDEGPATLTDAHGDDVAMLRVAVAPPRPSIAIVAVGFVTDQEHGGGWVQFQVRNRGPDPVALTGVLTTEDGGSADRPVGVPSDTTRWFEWRVDEVVSGVIDVTLLDDDGVAVGYAALALDDVTPVSVRVVGPPLPSLERVLSALPNVTLSRVDVADAALAPVDLEIVHGAVEGGAMRGHRLYIAAVPPDLAAGEPLDGPWQTVLAGNHPLLGPGASTVFDVDSLLPARVREGGNVLGWAEGWPAVQAARLSAGAEVVVAFDPEGSSDGQGEWSVAALVMRYLQWIEPGLGAGAERACRVGRPCALPERGSGSARIHDPAGHVMTPHLYHGRFDVPTSMAVASFDPWFVPTRGGWHRVEIATTHDVRLWVAPDVPTASVATVSGTSDVASWSNVPTTTVPIDPWRLAAVVAVLVAASIAWWAIVRSRGRMTVRFAVLVVGSVTVVGGAVGVVSEWPLPRGIVTETWAVVVQPSVPLEEVRGVSDVAHVVVAAQEPEVVHGSDVRGLHTTSQGETPGVWDGSGADVAAALTWAHALASAADAGRVGLVASALPVDGALQRSLSAAEAPRDVEVVRVPTARGDAVRIRDTHVLGRAWEGATVRVAVTLDAVSEANVEVRVVHDESVWATLRTHLAPGMSTLLVDIGVSTVERLELELVDVDRPDAPSQIVDVPFTETVPLRVAVMATDATWSLLFAQLLEVHGLEARVIDPASAPLDPTGWRDVDALVLFDLPAIALDSVQQRAIATWVERDGGGVLIAGGENAFGPGGYHLSVLDELSPLAAEIPMDRPDVAVVFVLDRSGSMVQAVGETTRLEIAREATWEAITLLDPRSQVGIVVFDSNSTMIHPVRPIEDRATVRRSLDLLTAGGGTALFPALVQAHGAMAPITDVPRHVVVMTDGLTQSGDFDAITSEYVRDDITVSTVAIGRGASYPRLRLIAEETGGTFYESVDFNLLPSIMAQEVLMLTTDAVRHAEFEPIWTSTPGAFSDGVTTEWPQLAGMVRTTPKDGAVIHAVGVDGDALLASWELGLGRVAAFTSQPVGPWSTSWLREPDLPRLWAQVLRWSAVGSTSERLQPFVRVGADGIEIDVVARRLDGRPATALPLMMAATRDGASPQELYEVEPGRYVGTAAPHSLVDGVLHVFVSGSSPGSWRDLELRPGTEARPPRHVDHRDVSGLHVLGSVGGGRVVGPSDGFVVGPRTWSWHPAPQWRSWLLACLSGLLVVLAARYWTRRTPPAPG